MSKTWLITGTSPGPGRLMTERLLERGDRVLGTVRKPDALKDLQAVHAAKLGVVVMDLTDAAAVETAIDDAFAQAGRIDMLVSNAGYGLFGAAEELSMKEIERQIATNLLGSIALIRAALPHLRRQGGGRIVQVSSEGGQIAYPGFSAYHASKWGIEGFIESVAQEVAPFGIDFVIAEPGPTATQFGANLAQAQPMPDYAATPAGEVRRAITGGGFPIKGDGPRTADAIVAAADAAKPSFRRGLGATASASISHALRERLAGIAPQRASAEAADRADTRLPA